MSKLTVQAMDSAAAMDEIVSKLGPDAVILSTTKLNGKVVMEAASGTPVKCYLWMRKSLLIFSLSK